MATVRRLAGARGEARRSRPRNPSGCVPECTSPAGRNRDDSTGRPGIEAGRQPGLGRANPLCGRRTANGRVEAGAESITIGQYIQRIWDQYRRLRNLHEKERQLGKRIRTDLVALVNVFIASRSNPDILKILTMSDSPTPGAGLAQAIEIIAGEGVMTLEIVPRMDGSSEVSVDGEEPFTLSREPAALLRILSMDSGEKPDHLVGWKSRDEVLRLLEAQIGVRLNAHALANLVHRLKQELATKGGLLPKLVASDRHLGLRFNLRRPRGGDGH